MRTHKKWTRMYVDGIDISGYIRDFGKASSVTEAVPDASVIDAVKNTITGQTTVTLGPLNAILDNDPATYPAGLFASFSTAGVVHYPTVVVGTPNGPVMGDPMFAWAFDETSWKVQGGGNTGFIAVNLTLDRGAGGLTGYDDGWGYVLHAKAAETAVNSSNTPNVVDWGRATSLGGLFVYHLFTASGGGAGTVTLTMQDSADGSTGWANVTGATSGALTTGAVTTTPAGLIVPLATNQTVKEFTRWQLAFGGSCTSATFFMGFVRET